MKTFLGIPEVPIEKAQAIIVPVPFEKSTSYGHGAKNGPQAIIEASQEVELYDPVYGIEVQEKVLIATAKPVKGDYSSMEKVSAGFIDTFPIFLGGEHSITPALIKPWLKKYPDLSVLQIDAHTDMRDSYQGNKWSHACAMRRVQELGVSKIVQVGIRNTAKEEQQYLKKENIFWGDIFNMEEVMSRLSNNVYLTFDVDGLDPSIMSATGTPEPGGLSYKQAIELLQTVTKRKNVVAADFVELSPVKGLHACDFLVAKLIFQLIGYKFLVVRNT